MDKVAVFIPVRGGSKTIPLKNIKEIAGKPLVYWVIEAALGACCVDKVYVATDSFIIAQKVREIKDHRLIIINRDPVGATDQAPSEKVLFEFCERFLFEHIFFIQATSPLLTSEDLDCAWQRYKCEKFDSIISVVRQKRFLWQVDNGIVKPINYDPLMRPRRQEFDGYLVENGAFYLSHRDKILQSRCRVSGKIGYWEMAEESYFELDEQRDWIIVEQLLISKIHKVGSL
jgi:N-acylneuraminate cytidylyltransferase